MSPNAPEKENTGRFNNLDFLRLMLAIMVILSHSYPLAWGSNEYEPLRRLTGGQMTAGELAVAGFFILSGFLITKSWLHAKSPGDYLKRRVLRIYPGYLVAVTFCAFVFGPMAASQPSDYWHELSLKRFVIESLNLEGVTTPPILAGNPTHGINGSLWSIRYEFFCYLAVAALGLAGALRRRWLVLLVFLVCFTVYAMQIQLGIEIPGSRLTRFYCYPGFWPRLSTCFFAGALFYLYRDRITYSFRGFAAACLGLAVLAALPGLNCLVLAVPLLGSFVFFYLGFLPIRQLHGFARRGDLSYGMYLYAFPVQQLVMMYLGPGLHPLTLFLLATAFTTIFAALSWCFVEQPFMKLKRSAGREAVRSLPLGEIPAPS
jgi:peptidoglycan/LPS O-acetylase OafA/YrhL